MTPIKLRIRLKIAFVAVVLIPMTAATAFSVLYYSQKIQVEATTSNPVQGHGNSIDEWFSALPTTRRRASGGGYVVRKSGWPLKT